MMASSFAQPKPRPHHYQPVFHSRYPPPHLNNPKKPAGHDHPPIENPSHFSESLVTRPMPPSGQPACMPAGAGSVHDRLAKLEAALPAIHEAHQRETSALRAEVESLRCLLNSKPSLNKNAAPFVPGPAPMTPPTPVNLTRPSPPGLSFPALFGPDSDLPPSIAPSGPTAFDLLPPHEQIYSLSQQVNVLSTTISQLLTTLLATSNGPVPANLALPLASTRMSPPCGPNGTPPSPTAAAAFPNTSALAHAKKAVALQSLGRSAQRHPGNLVITPSLPSPIPSGHNSTDPQLGAGQSRPNSHLRPRLFSPTCQTPVSASAPLSPLQSFDTSSAAAPMNSLAGKWEQLGIAGDVLRAIVRFGVGPPSKTQQKSIPNMLLGKDLISQSNPIQERIQSYIIPALQLIANDMHGPANISSGVSKGAPAGQVKSNASVKVLVIAATLDEAAQAHRLARGIAALLPHPPKIVHCGGSQSAVEASEPMGTAHHTEPHLLIGTPSKLLDPVNGLRGYTFDAGSFICVILDEMDQLLARNLSDMVTSLMAFLPSNSSAGPHASETSQPNPSLLSSKHGSETSCSPPTSISASEEWSSSQPRQSPLNSVGSLCSNDSRIAGRQTCIFSCTVPQDVLAYARSLNLRVKVIVRREESNNSVSCNTPSALTPMTSNFDLGDPRTPHLSTFPWTNQSGNGNSTSTHQLLRHLSQFFYRAEPSSFSSPNLRERKLQSLIDLLFHKEVASLRAGRGQLVIIYCNSVDSVDVVSCTLAQNNIDVIALHQDMGPAARHSLLAKFGQAARESTDDARAKTMKVLVVYDVLSKTLADISKDQPSIVINFELPRAVEDYIHRAGCIISIMNGSQSRRASINGNYQDAALINLVNAGSEIDTIKSIESFYRCKIQELRGSSSC